MGAQIMEGSVTDEEDAADEQTDDLFTLSTTRLLQLFKRDFSHLKRDRQMLEERGRLIIRQLCGHLNARRLYLTVARSIRQETTDLESLEFAQQLVQTMSWILFTAAETQCLRDELANTPPPRDSRESSPQEKVAKASDAATGSHSLFLELLEPWFHNPVSALALCLWAQ